VLEGLDELADALGLELQRDFIAADAKRRQLAGEGGRVEGCDPVLR